MIIIEGIRSENADMSSENIVWNNITVYRRFSEEYFTLRVKRPLRVNANVLFDG